MINRRSDGTWHPQSAAAAHVIRKLGFFVAEGRVQHLDAKEAFAGRFVTAGGVRPATDAENALWRALQQEVARRGKHAE